MMTDPDPYYRRPIAFVPIVGFFWMMRQEAKMGIRARPVMVIKNFALLFAGLIPPFILYYGFKSSAVFFIVFFLFDALIMFIAPPLIVAIGRHEIEAAKKPDSKLAKTGNFAALEKYSIGLDAIYSVNYHEFNLFSSGLFVALVSLLVITLA